MLFMISFPCSPHAEYGGYQNHANRNHAGDGNGVHQFVGKRGHIASNGIIHSVVNAGSGNQGKDGNDKIGNSGLFADSCHNVGVKRSHGR